MCDRGNDEPARVLEADEAAVEQVIYTGRQRDIVDGRFPGALRGSLRIDLHLDHGGRLPASVQAIAKGGRDRSDRCASCMDWVRGRDREDGTPAGLAGAAPVRRGRHSRGSRASRSTCPLWPLARPGAGVGVQRPRHR
jgi:hypothetical protein